MFNIITLTDSYKLTHKPMYPDGTTGVYSYLEARKGAEYDETVFFGLQSILKQIEGSVVTQEDVDAAADLAIAHFGDDNLFNREGWEYIVNEHDGKLPIRIKAVPEGSVIPVGNVLMTVENTDPKCFWLTNALESLLLHVWYPTTVATLSYNVKKMIKDYLDVTADSDAGLPFMLHDFGFRGATTSEAAAIGGAGHLVNFMGTDTLPAMELLLRDYDADIDNLAFSVPATEHSVMTSQGQAGERGLVKDLIESYPRGILSVVADSYNIYRFVDELGTIHKDAVLARDGKFVVRPDSVTDEHPTPEILVVDLLERLGKGFGFTFNEKGFKVLNPKVGMLWGDGIDPNGIRNILATMADNNWSAENIVFGMGGGLLQKVNRDTQQFAFKCSAQERGGAWLKIQKNPLDKTKVSKAGRLALIELDGTLMTMSELPGESLAGDKLELVFENGEVLRRQTLDEIRALVALPELAAV